LQKFLANVIREKYKTDLSFCRTLFTPVSTITVLNLLDY